MFKRMTVQLAGVWPAALVTVALLAAPAAAQKGKVATVPPPAPAPAPPPSTTPLPTAPDAR